MAFSSRQFYRKINGKIWARKFIIEIVIKSLKWLSCSAICKFKTMVSWLKGLVIYSYNRLYEVLFCITKFIILDVKIQPCFVFLFIRLFYSKTVFNSTICRFLLPFPLLTIIVKYICLKNIHIWYITHIKRMEKKLDGN